MAKHERNRFVSMYHSLVAILILIGGGALLGFGIWLRVTDRAGPLNLEYTGSNVFRLVLNASVGSMVIGGFLLLTGVVSLIAMGRRCVGVTFRVVYIIMALVITAVLAFVCVVSSLIVTQGDDDNVREFIGDAWARTVVDRPDDVCKIEKNFKCRGFGDNDCALCPTGLEPDCGPTTTPNCAKCPSNAPPATGCYDEILADAKSLFRPMAIVSGIIAGIVLLDVFITCCL